MTSKRIVEEEPLPLDEPQQFLRLLWELSHAIETRSRQMAQRFGLTFQQRTLLRLIGRFPGVTAGRLAQTLHLEPGTVSITLKRLESRGLVERRPDPKDRRRICLGLTARGRKLDAPIPGTVEEAARAALQAVSVDEMTATATVLRTLIKTLGAPISPD